MSRPVDDRQPRILFFAPAGEYGGAYSLLHLLVQAKGRFEPVVVCPAPTTLSARLNELGIEYHRFETNRYSLKRRPDWHVQMIWKLRRLIVSRRIDIVVVNHTGNFPLILLASKLARRPVVRFMRHCLAGLSGGRYSFVDQQLARYCRALIFITSFIETETRRELQGCPSTGVVLYNPQPIVSSTQPSENETVRREFGLAHNALVLGIFGRIEPCKGQDILLKALSRIVVRYPSLRLLVVGDGDHRPRFRAELESLLDAHDLRPHVIFAGRRSDVIRLMGACTFMVVPSRSEALGRVLLESWAVRRPVVGSDVEGIREVVEQSGGGLLFKSESAEELAERIVELLDDPAKRDALAARGQQWLAENCAPARYADRFTLFMRECLGQARVVTAASSEVDARPCGSQA